MPYTAEITRASPACFIFLVDQSSSMLERFGGEPEKQKSEGVADALNRLLQNLILRCAKYDGIHDYFYVGIIGYGGRVASALGGKLAGQSLLPISVLADNALRVEQRMRKVSDGAGGIVEQSLKFPVWLEPKARGRTPMCEALNQARQYLEEFLRRFPSGFPPVVINITDGMATDGDPLPVARSLREITTSDGNVLLFNAHISEAKALPIELPAVEDGLPDTFARLLFRMSSPLPPQLLESARREGLAVWPGSRGFVFNADLVTVIRFLDIGTRVVQSVREGT